MAKIERVIEVFECLLDIDKPCEDTCSYSLGDYRCDTTRLYKETLELLKKQQPKKGEWVIDEYNIHHCPFCHAVNETVYRNFCPNCGADMRGEQE